MAAAGRVTLRLMGNSTRPSRRILLSLLGTASLVPAERISGGWSATVGGRKIGGAWTAEPHGDEDAAWGTWSLLDPSGKRIASGTWGARKVKGRWEDLWRAEVDGRGGHSGTWTADVQSKGSSRMYELFRKALDSAV